MKLEVTVSAARAVVRGHPWVYREGVVLGRGRKVPATGEVVELVDNAGASLGRALFDADSPIAVRIYPALVSDRDPARAIVGAIERAIARRTTWLDPAVTNAYRMVHGEGDRVPGFVLDRYGEVAVARLDGNAIAVHFDRIAQGIEPLLRARGIRSLYLRGAADSKGDKSTRVFGDEITAPIDVIENGMQMEVDIARGQKTGAFLDQRDNRLRVRELAARGGTALNLYSYAGGFSIAAALGGMRSVTSVDIANEAHRTAQRSFKKNGLEIGPHRFVTADVFTYLEGAASRGEKFSLVISDPPSFAPSERAKPKALSAYARLHRAAAALVEDGGIFCAASCSSHISSEAFLETLTDDALGTSAFIVRGVFGSPNDHPTTPAFPEGRYLKLVVMTRG